jgi:hypothetical protein
MADSVDEIIEVEISASGAQATLEGFGTPLIASYSAAWTERTRSYRSALAVETDFPAGSFERKAAEAFFAQTPKSGLLKFGRFSNKPTVKFDLTAITPTTFVTSVYRVKVTFGITTTEVSFTSGASPTDALWAAGMVAALNAVPGKNFTATGATSPVSVTGNAPGNFFTIEVVNRAQMDCTLNHVDPGVAADLAAINAEDNGWYALALQSASSAMILSAASWVEASKKLYLAQSSDTKILSTIALSAADPFDLLKVLNYKRSSKFSCYHPDPASFLVVRIYGKCLRFVPGQETWALKQLAGVAGYNLTDTEKTNLYAKGGSQLLTVKGITFTWQLGSNGEWVDAVRVVDKTKDDMQTAIFNYQLSLPKIPYTDAGMVGIKGVLLGVLQAASADGRIDSDYTLTVPKVTTQSTIDRAARYFPGIVFTARTQGAVHRFKITGVLGQ